MQTRQKFSIPTANTNNSVTIEIKLLYNGCMWEEEIVFDTRFPNCKLQPLNHYLSEDLAIQKFMVKASPDTVYYKP